MTIGMWRPLDTCRALEIPREVPSYPPGPFERPEAPLEPPIGNADAVLTGSDREGAGSLTPVSAKDWNRTRAGRWPAREADPLRGY